MRMSGGLCGVVGVSGGAGEGGGGGVGGGGGQEAVITSCIIHLAANDTAVVTPLGDDTKTRCSPL